MLIGPGIQNMVLEVDMEQEDASSSPTCVLQVKHSNHLNIFSWFRIFFNFTNIKLHLFAVHHLPAAHHGQQPGHGQPRQRGRGGRGHRRRLGLSHRAHRGRRGDSGEFYFKIQYLDNNVLRNIANH